MRHSVAFRNGMMPGSSLWTSAPREMKSNFASCRMFNALLILFSESLCGKGLKPLQSGGSSDPALKDGAISKSWQHYSCGAAILSLGNITAQPTGQFLGLDNITAAARQFRSLGSITAQPAGHFETLTSPTKVVDSRQPRRRYC